MKIVQRCSTQGGVLFLLNDRHDLLLLLADLTGALGGFCLGDLGVDDVDHDVEHQLQRVILHRVGLHEGTTGRAGQLRIQVHGNVVEAGPPGVARKRQVPQVLDADHAFRGGEAQLLATGLFKEVHGVYFQKVVGNLRPGFGVMVTALSAGQP